jgi:hypothetical protein
MSNMVLIAIVPEAECSANGVFGIFSKAGPATLERHEPRILTDRTDQFREY